LNQTEWPKVLEGEKADDFVGRYYIIGVEYEKEEQYKAEMI